MNFSVQESAQSVPIIGKSHVIGRIHELVQKVADSDSTVLLLGESGTGKELIARNLHFSSRRHARPFIPVNCGAIPSELLESELFGHEKGAFTGAISSRMGRFELAHGGTLFLDEVGEMSSFLQVKLLRVLQERSFERVGGTKTVSVDVRIIAATNRDLESAAGEGKFREDLYYRLNVIPIEVPPLRRRRDDIPVLCEHFIIKHAKRCGRKPIRFSESAMKSLVDYHWPGNVRELENIIERLFVLKDDDVVRPADLPERIGGESIPDMSHKGETEINPFAGGIDLNAAVDEYERRLIIHALEFHRGVKSRAAQYLRVNRTTLIEKMKRLNLSSLPSRQDGD